MKISEKVDQSMDWFRSLDDEDKNLVVGRLFFMAFNSEEIRIHSLVDQTRMETEDLVPEGHYRAPYYESCGEPLNSHS